MGGPCVPRCELRDRNLYSNRVNDITSVESQTLSKDLIKGGGMYCPAHNRARCWDVVHIMGQVFAGYCSGLEFMLKCGGLLLIMMCLGDLVALLVAGLNRPHSSLSPALGAS